MLDKIWSFLECRRPLEVQWQSAWLPVLTSGQPPLLIAMQEDESWLSQQEGKGLQRASGRRIQ